MNKRGQFYILTVMIASFVIYGLVSNDNAIREPILFSGFDRLSENYLHEVPVVLNENLKTGTTADQAKEELDKFTKKYVNYAQQKNPTIGLFYVISDVKPGERNEVTVTNYLSKSIYNNKGTIILGSYDETIQNVNVEVGSQSFLFNFPIRVNNFGEEFYQFTGRDTELDLQISGIVHSINYPKNKPSYTVYVETSKDNTVEVLKGGEGGNFIP